MLRKMFQIYTLLELVMVLAVTSAQAQTVAKAHIPFDFNIGEQTYQPGDYTLGWTSQSSKDVLTIRNQQTGKASIVMVNPKEGDNTRDISKLLFNHYDNQYFLSEMITARGGAEFQKSKTEARLAKARKPSKETVAMIKQN